MSRTPRPIADCDGTSTVGGTSGRLDIFAAAAREYSARSRVAQGLPARVNDPSAIARVVAMLTAGG